MKNPFLLLALLSCLAGALSAQAPGYLGKRIFLKPEFSSMFALSKPTAANRGGDTYGEQGSRLGFNTRWGAQLGYALSRRRALTLEGSYIGTGMVLSASTPSAVYDGYTDEHYLFYQLSGPEAGISFQTYNPLKGSIAPMGFYSAWRLRMAFLKGDILDKRTHYAQDDAGAGHALLGIDPKFNFLTVGFELGQNVVLFDRLLLSISGEANLSPLGPIIKRKQQNDGDFYSNQSAFDRAAFDRMRWHSLFMFKVGLGYML